MGIKLESKVDYFPFFFMWQILSGIAYFIHSCFNCCHQSFLTLFFSVSGFHHVFIYGAHHDKVIIWLIYKRILHLYGKTVNTVSDKEKQIERIKEELALYLRIAERLGFPKNEIEKQVNLYLDSLNKLKQQK